MLERNGGAMLMTDALEKRVTALENKLKDIDEQPVSGSVEFRLSRQIKRLDHKIDLVGEDVAEFREVVEQRLSSLESDMAKVLLSLNRIFDKLDKPGSA